jgi:hypothetical protein
MCRNNENKLAKKSMKSLSQCAKTESYSSTAGSMNHSLSQNAEQESEISGVHEFIGHNMQKESLKSAAELMDAHHHEHRIMQKESWKLAEV